MIWRLLLPILAVFVAAHGNAQTGISIPAGQTVKIDAHGVCLQVKNPGSGTRMVFIGTANEWNSFRNYPNGLTFSACTVPCYLNGLRYEEGSKAVFYKYPAQGGLNGRCNSSTEKTCQNGVFVSKSSFYETFIYTSCTWLPRTYGTSVVGCSSSSQPTCPAGVDDGNYHSIPCYDTAFSCGIKTGASCNSWKTIICRSW